MRPLLKLYIATVSVLAVVLVVGDLSRESTASLWDSLGMIVVLIGACAAADHLGFQIRRGFTITAGAVPHMAAAFLLPPGVAPIVACLGALTRVITHRHSAGKGVFNLASIALSVWVAAHIVEGIGGSELLLDGNTWRGPIAAMVASACYYFATNATIAGAVALDQRRSFWKLLRGEIGFKALVEMGLGLVGATLAVLATHAPAWAPTFVLPSVLVYLARQTMDAASRRSRDLALTSAVGRAVAGTLKPEVAFAAITTRDVRETLKLDGMALVPLDADDEDAFADFVAADEDPVALRGALAEEVARLGQRVELRGTTVDAPDWLPPETENLAATAIPFGVAGGKPVGALIAWRAPQMARRRTAFNSEELLVLETLADYAAVALETARLAAAQALQEVEALRSLARMKDEFIGQVSHELRTPLTMIHGFTEMVAFGLLSDTDAIRRMSRPAYESSTLMMRLVEDLLETAQIDSGKLALKQEDVDLAAWLARTVDAFASTTATHRVLADVPDALPMVQADLARMGQVLNNLLSNAVRYAPSGSTVRVSARALLASHEVEVRVSDEGPGIPLDDQVRVFEKFYRGKNSSIRSVRGTGLGLAVAKALVEAHRGTIGLESVPGIGATFWLRLPIASTASQPGTSWSGAPALRQTIADEQVAASA